ncbi:MAG: NAD(P)-dependent oxidoreductase [Firmicutes bacterium]|nr:NAD(P)-dependent oxidoreductase [Bacillota bacterium]
MKILVTGANGYLGSGIVKRLVDDGVQVIATDYSSEHIDPRAGIIEADLFSVNNPYEYFGKPDCVLHLAWKDGFKHSSPAHLEYLNVHFNFLKEMMDSGVRKVAVMGSMHEVGFYEGSIDENTPCRPLSMYGISKNALRDAVMLEAKNHSVLVQWLRGFYIVGNTEYGCSVFSKIVQAEKRGDQEFPFTLGMNQYDFTDYDEFCEQVSAAVEQDDVLGVINCCSGYPMRLGERAEKFISENEFKIKLKYGAFPDRPYDSKAIWGDSRKIKKILENRKAVVMK